MRLPFAGLPLDFGALDNSHLLRERLLYPRFGETNGWISRSLRNYLHANFVPNHDSTYAVCKMQLSQHGFPSPAMLDRLCQPLKFWRE